MNELYLILGILLYIIVALDIIKTTLSSTGGGYITNKIAQAVWKVWFLLSGKNGKSKMLQYAGPTVLVSILVFWVATLWGGYFLMILSDPDSIKKSSTLEVALPLEKLYYAGYVVSTLGIGDYVANNHAWRITTNVIAFSGLAFITASITYFVQILSANGLQNSLATYISGLGSTPQQILLYSWNGKDFSKLSDKISDLSQMIIQHTMNHHSYPIIHYFHNNNPQQSITPSMARLYDAYCLLENAVKEDANLSQVDRSMLGNAFEAYHHTMLKDFVKQLEPGLTTPALPTDSLMQEGVPVLQEPKEQSLPPKYEKQRMLYTKLLQKEGWGWEQVYKITEAS